MKHICPNCDHHIPLNTPEEKFWIKVDKHGPPAPNNECEGPCWLWCGAMDSSGYGIASFYFGDGKRNKGAHRVAWEFYHKLNVSEGMLVRHICDNRQCVNPDHLILGTVLDNSDDMIRRGRAVTPRGENAGGAILTEKQVIEIREQCASGDYTHEEIGKKYGINQRTVGFVFSRRSWTHVPISEKEKFLIEKGASLKMTEGKVRDIKLERAQGITMFAIAKKYGVTKKVIANIVYGVTWKNVAPEIKLETRKKVKLTKNDVRNIREEHDTNVPVKEIATKYNITKTMVYSIVNRKTWKNVA